MKKVEVQVGQRVRAYGYGNDGMSHTVALRVEGQTGTVIGVETWGYKIKSDRMSVPFWVYKQQVRRLKPKAPKSGAV